MNYLKVIWSWAWAAITLVMLVGLGLIFMPEYQKYHENKENLQKLQDALKAEDALISQLQDDQRRFKTDPDFVEEVAHEKGLAHPGEIIFKFVDEPAYSDAAVQPHAHAN